MQHHAHRTGRVCGVWAAGWLGTRSVTSSWSHTSRGATLYCGIAPIQHREIVGTGFTSGVNPSGIYPSGVVLSPVVGAIPSPVVVAVPSPIVGVVPVVVVVVSPPIVGAVPFPVVGAVPSSP